LYLESYSKPNKKSWKCDYYSLNAHLNPYFGEFKVGEITTLKIEKYRAERLKEGVRKSTTNRELALLKRMFNLAVDWGYLQENRARKIKQFSEKDNIKERVLSEQEEPRLLEESTDHLKPIITTALNTGMRKSEILNLKWDQIDLEQRFILIENTKSGENRTVPINDVLLEVVKNLETNKKSNYVFSNPETSRPFKTVRRAFENACRRAGITNMRFHDLRHTFGTRLIQRGVDIVTVQNLLGHHSVTVTQRYTHSNREQKREAVEILARKKAKKPDVLAHICHTKEKGHKEKEIIPPFSMN
jgi:integrase